MRWRPGALRLVRSAAGLACLCEREWVRPLGRLAHSLARKGVVPDLPSPARPLVRSPARLACLCEREWPQTAWPLGPLACAQGGSSPTCRRPLVRSSAWPLGSLLRVCERVRRPTAWPLGPLLATNGGSSPRPAVARSSARPLGSLARVNECARPLGRLAHLF